MAREGQRRRECVIMEEQEAVPFAWSKGTGLLRAHVSVPFDPGILCLKNKNHPCSILEMERIFFQFDAVFLSACGVAVPTPAHIFPVCFFCPMFQVERRGVQQHGNCRNWQADSTIHLEMKRI